MVNAAVFHHRRAERFAQLLDEADGLRHLHSRSRLDAELVPLVTIGQRVTRFDADVQPDLDFRVGLRAMLVATAERDGIGRTDTAPAKGHRVGPRVGLAGPGVRRPARARGAIIIGVAAGTLALSGMSAASGDAVPGDALYGIKRSTERAQLALASSDVSRGQLHLEFAKTRLAEAAAVRQEPAGLAGVLEDMDAETRQGVKLLNTAAVQRRDPAALDVVNEFVTDQRRRMAVLLDGLPAEGRPQVLESLTLLESVTRRTSALRTALNCGATGVGDDALGPLPNICHAAGTPARTPTGDPAPTGGSTARSSAGEQANGTVPAPTAAVPSAAPAEFVPPVEAPTAADDGGLLSDVGRLLGDLLGN